MKNTFDVNKMGQLENLLDDMSTSDIADLFTAYDKIHHDKNISYLLYHNYITDTVCEELETTIKFEKNNIPDSELVKRYNQSSPCAINDWAEDVADVLEDEYSETLVNYLDQVAYNEL